MKPEQKEMRAVFAECMDELAQNDKRVVYLDCDLMNSIGMTGFSKKYPAQTINCGIQEANMIGAAAGMSAAGLIPFVHTFGPFATRRVMDQVFVSAAYARLNLKIIGSDPGVTASLNGGTHMPFEDLAVMRSIPEVTVMEPTDSVMLTDILRQVKDLYGVFYIRLSRKISQHIYGEGTAFSIGKGIQLCGGTDAAIIASGICVAEALFARDILEKEGIHTRVINIFTIKPIDREIIIKAAAETGALVTAENHNIINGLGSAVAEVLSENYPVPMERIGIKDRFGEVGTEQYLKEKFGLTARDIAAAVKRAIQRKK